MSINPKDIEGIGILQSVSAEALEDESFLRELRADPKAVLRDRGLEVCDDVDIQVLQNRPDLVYLVLPSAPVDVDELREHPRHGHRILNWWPV